MVPRSLARLTAPLNERMKPRSDGISMTTSTPFQGRSKGCTGGGCSLSRTYPIVEWVLCPLLGLYDRYRLVPRSPSLTAGLPLDRSVI